MSNSRMLFDGRRQPPGKSNFVHTCNLLSRYVKEKGSFRDLNIEIDGKVESLESLVKPGSAHFTSASATLNHILINKGNLAQLHQSMEQQLSMPISNVDPKASQLTIFYSGRVVVFDDYPAHKAQELMAFARKESSHMSCGILSKHTSGLPPRPPPSHNPSCNACCKDKTTATASPYPHSNGASDLPIARRTSLHRFLEKRKDRAAARGPYHHVKAQAGSSTKGDEDQLDLKL